ncbi:LytTR family DNA-binding domain-containing protein [Brevibacillus ginsengisoli]|uniref:LytTR family DNA-binding domain-containing protein n=1 Tax=Brevibacillus ginsengisoli TaxID=363854 RepID=UPI003CF50A96
MDTQTITSIMGVISELLPKHTSIAISDRHQYIYYKPSKSIDLSIQPGDRIKEGSLTSKALSVQHRLSEYIDSSVFGTSYFGMSVPIFEEGQPQACITAILPYKPSQPAFLTVKTDDRWIPVPNEQVLYLEAQNRKTKVKSQRIEGYHKCNLSELELILPPDEFIRVHRSYIVNINYIHEIQPDSHSTFLLIMKDQTKIPVSQSFSSYFRKVLNF